MHTWLLYDAQVRDKSECPASMTDSTRIWIFNGADGDFNQGMNSGGDVAMCEARYVQP